MRTIYGEQRGVGGDTEHNKGYRITDDGVSTVLTEWGPIGNLRSKKVICESADPAERAKAFDKQFKAKFNKKENPYVVIEQNGQRTENRPSSEGRAFGLEVETHSRVGIDEIISKLKSRGLNVRDRRNSYFHSDGSVWDVKYDSSAGYEFASPILSGSRGIFDAKLAVEKIREVGGAAAANANCGVHVTVDIGDHSFEDFKRLVIGYLRCQKHFYDQVHESRSTNQYCVPNPTHLIESILRATTVAEIRRLASNNHRGERYHGLNLTHAGRAEFRHMEGNVSIRNIAAWIRLCVSFVDGVKKSGVKFKSTTPISKETFDKIAAGVWTP